ncbi:hypothetical protein FD18_GL000183 [Lactobacillus taiwanensis DSM 21401]|uniref:DUF4811 domain-containing protein n=1 Tax=Lactobacillus taiwanensis TaxID=508451 RepID=A0A256LC11_9LACO|nr:DUF4811 domain-containing protein [Lactobacillus taiwanensis]KRM99095.1 hypothetical protein FD18_GL000183 [Lactobacillus taiwanensis DSM 21401]OYR86693.1 DUF4811 domain-containing protein [Lactobacillus taiwanensis]OYR90092.1 DUF4811 domain-containing protein [Lactobacillus taiwanensis]OYR92954.1 DUF4811 domain-containing protein [Lactobacillus taiwanensis]OYR95277.1 DUF4811 domain-containing protein [Lactobacillus taiwanensis]
MIIIVLILAALLFIYFNVIPGKGHTFAAWISLIVTSLCILGIVAHDYNHWGMKTETQTVNHSLVSSATPNLPLLLYRPLGNGTEKIYLYKTNDSQKKLKAIKLDKVSTKINHSKKPTLQIKTTRYVYSDNFSKIMFSVFGHNNELKQRKYIFAIPSNWKVISTKDMQKLQKQMRERMQARKVAVLH